MTAPSASARPLDGVAIVVSAGDNVAVVRVELAGGQEVALQDGAVVRVGGPLVPGHRFATVAIPSGEYVVQYGQPIGTSRGIALGEPVTHENMSDDVPVVRTLPADLSNPPPDYIPGDRRARFEGFCRPDGRVGTRNHVLIVPTSMCSSHEAQQIATVADLTLFSREQHPNVDGVVALPHNKGCGGSDGSHIEVMMRTLVNYARHPNIGGVLFIELGCEKTNNDFVRRWMEERDIFLDVNAQFIGVQECGGTKQTVKRGLDVVGELLDGANHEKRTPCGADTLVLGVKCGGSDGFSGLSCNPSLGVASDLVASSGGTVLITEIPEFCGAEHIVAMRARDADVGQQVFDAVDWYKRYAAAFGSTLEENPSPGNKAGGLLNITTKSLGAIAKAGTTRVEGVTGYAERPEGRGLHVMQGPGYDQESTPGLVGAGANVVVFTTGRGTTIGNAICPVIKLASNTGVFERMGGDLDLNAGTVIDGTESIEEVGQRVFEKIVAVAGGLPAKAEENGHREFQFWAEQSVSL